MSKHNAQRTIWMKKRYHHKMANFRAYLGNKCAQCQKSDELEFDHIDPATKLFTIGQRWDYAWGKMKTELDKCQLLCKTCHRAKSIAMSRVNHGYPRLANRLCTCPDCKARANSYRREHRTRRKIALSFNGRTAPFEGAYVGSSPAEAASYKKALRSRFESWGVRFLQQAGGKVSQRFHNPPKSGSISLPCSQNFNGEVV